MKETFQISDSLAQTIVEAAKEVIGKDINFINLDGKIIASTNVERLGTYHEAAVHAQKDRNTIEVFEDDTFKGAQQGINYPVVINEKLFCIIGISGDPKECHSLGFLLTKITEVFIKEQMISTINHSLDELRSSITRMLIFNEENKTLSMKEQLEQLHYELEDRAFVVIIHRHGFNNSTSLPINIPDFLMKHHIQLYTYLFPNQYILIINKSQYKTSLKLFTFQFNRFKANFSIGVGSLHSLEQLDTSYKHAKLALKAALSKKALLCEYVKLDFEAMLETIDFSVKKDYVKKLISTLSEDEISLLKAYYKSNLSLKQTAETLFIHKNTLQYRLDKIAHKTNLNPRDYHDSVKLYVALLLQDNQ
ncbi:CdaR family transcriptional regulator [Bacillus taeanensis]|uniref:CdaR family transcriptional regulator n=1 Tax=Bacillus taeanensis TaxID=273032 RepID=UPI0015F1128F|nr:sugar diacid recognition domain-containing protein [Bacillus taeanensis]